MSTGDVFPVRCNCGATIQSNFPNCPWCGMERKREVFKAPAHVSSEWLLTEEEIDNIRFKLTEPTSNDEDWIKQVRLTASQSIARVQLRKVAEKLEAMRAPFSPEHTGGVIEIILNRDEYHTLLQEAGLEVKDA